MKTRSTTEKEGGGVQYIVLRFYSREHPMQQKVIAVDRHTTMQDVVDVARSHSDEMKDIEFDPPMILRHGFKDARFIPSAQTTLSQLGLGTGTRFTFTPWTLLDIRHMI